jgi:hypothetical protein
MITLNEFNINQNSNKRIFVVDNFYSDPLAVREFALNQNFIDDQRYYKGRRTGERFIIPGTKEAFEKLLDFKITSWDNQPMNGMFQSCNAQDSLVYHTDAQSWAAIVYLTPNAPFECGTSLYADKWTKARRQLDPGMENTFSGGFYDKTRFELVDSIGNVFNRLIIFDSKCIHAASQYFGQTIQDSRLFHMFFFE